MKLRIGILGTRGIPNHYGGFEYFAEHLSQSLANRGHELYVYNSHNHPNQQPIWKKVNIVHCYDPEYKYGSFGQFLYDLNCIRDARKRNFDVLLFLGYTSSSVWGMLYPKKPIIIYNMDGFEWKRTKYSKPIQQFLKLAEKLAVKYSDFIVADSTHIQEYITEKYKRVPEYIAYGAEVFSKHDIDQLIPFKLSERSYNMVMARMEPENNIEMVLDGYRASGSQKDMIIVGSTDNKFGTYLKNKFAGDPRIRFLGAIFDRRIINNLIYHSNLYFHGHSVGGTNPSLLEAMGSHGLIVAMDNVFNRSVLTGNAFYFTTSSEVTQYANLLTRNELHDPMIKANAATIREKYNWPGIVDEYEKFFLDCYSVVHPVIESPKPVLLHNEA
jgi:glycosyltransferase involved in cell wall biosynthesis